MTKQDEMQLNKFIKSLKLYAKNNIGKYVKGYKADEILYDMINPCLDDIENDILIYYENESDDMPPEYAI